MVYEEPDPDLTKKQKELVKRLSSEKLKYIDKALLSNIDSKYYRKVARIIGSTMTECPDLPKKIPDVFYSQRIKKMVKSGHLESQGDLQYMRYSEVRLASKNENN